MASPEGQGSIMGQPPSSDGFARTIRRAWTRV
jgi:hypothetical protein